MEDTAAKLSDGHRKIMATKDVTISDFAKRTSIVMVLVVLVTFIVATLVTVLVSGGITRPVKSMAAHLHEMAQGGGDLTKRIDINSHDEVGQMASSFNLFVQKLEEIISEVRTSSDGIASAAGQVASSARFVIARHKRTGCFHRRNHFEPGRDERIDRTERGKTADRWNRWRLRDRATAKIPESPLAKRSPR